MVVLWPGAGCHAGPGGEEAQGRFGIRVLVRVPPDIASAGTITGWFRCASRRITTRNFGTIITSLEKRERRS